MKTDMKVVQCQDKSEMLCCMKLFKNCLDYDLLKNDDKLEQYCEKISRLGHMDYVRSNSGDVLAFIVYYANDIENKTVYISYLCANSNIGGIASQVAVIILLKNTLKNTIFAGLEYVRIEVQNDNEHAIKLYRRLGLSYEKNASKSSVYMFASLKKVELAFGKVGIEVEND